MYFLYLTSKKGIFILTEYLRKWWEKDIKRKSYFHDHVLNETVVMMVSHQIVLMVYSKRLKYENKFYSLVINE